MAVIRFFFTLFLLSVLIDARPLLFKSSSDVENSGEASDVVLNVRLEELNEEVFQLRNTPNNSEDVQQQLKTDMEGKTEEMTSQLRQREEEIIKLTKQNSELRRQLDQHNNTVSLSGSQAPTSDAAAGVTYISWNRAFCIGNATKLFDDYSTGSQKHSEMGVGCGLDLPCDNTSLRLLIVGSDAPGHQTSIDR